MEPNINQVAPISDAELMELERVLPLFKEPWYLNKGLEKIWIENAPENGIVMAECALGTKHGYNAAQLICQLRNTAPGLLARLRTAEANASPASLTDAAVAALGASAADCLREIRNGSADAGIDLAVRCDEVEQYISALLARSPAATTGETGAPASGVGEVAALVELIGENITREECCLGAPEACRECEKGEGHRLVFENTDSVARHYLIELYRLLAALPPAGAPIGAGEAAFQPVKWTNKQLLDNIAFIRKHGPDEHDSAAIDFGLACDYLEEQFALTPAASAPAVVAAETAGQGWVSVKERLPEVGIKVVVLYGSNSEFYSGEVESAHRVQPRESGKWWWAGLETIPDNYISHWMPLPAAPTNEEGAPTNG